MNKIDLEQLKGAINIMDLAKDLGLQIRHRQARCFNATEHKNGDKNFSMGLDIAKNRFKCFACGVQGSVIDLFMGVQGVDLKDAIKELSQRAGMDLGTPMTPHRTLYKPVRGEKAEVQPKEDIFAYSKIYEELCLFCAGLDSESVEYLKSRGLTEDTQKKFLLFSVKDYSATDKHLKEKFGEEKLRQAGVLGEKGNLLFYKHKIIIPFLQDGRIIFLQGRRVDDGQPKYLHLKQRPVPLYNVDTLSKKGKVYICEGVFDAMMLEQHGYTAVAILGTNNFKPEYTNLFKGFEVVLALDNDEAGKRGTQELAKMFLDKGQGASTKQLPDRVKDITDYFNSL